MRGSVAEGADGKGRAIVIDGGHFHSRVKDKERKSGRDRVVAACKRSQKLSLVICSKGVHPSNCITAQSRNVVRARSFRHAVTSQRVQQLCQHLLSMSLKVVIDSLRRWCLLTKRLTACRAMQPACTR